MEKLVIITLIINLLFIFSFIIFNKKIKEKIEKDKEEYKEKRYKEIYAELDGYSTKARLNYEVICNKLDNELEEKRKLYNSIIEENEEIIKREEEKKNIILNQKKEIIDKELEQYRSEEKTKIDNENKKFKSQLEEYFELKIQQLVNEYLNYEKINNEQKEELDKLLSEVKEELEDYRKRREAVNEAILREKEIQEKETFYKLNISSNDIEDIEVLRTIEPKLKNKEALNKLIFDVFIKKPMTEMIKRVLGGRAPSGIYKITYIPTGEAYIGKSTNVKSRWEQHCKSCFGLGTIAHSSLHIKMARDGIWNFTFELLEEVPKENLTEREKYYINFYDTVKFGMNEKVG